MLQLCSLAVLLVGCNSDDLTGTDDTSDGGGDGISGQGDWAELVTPREGCDPIVLDDGKVCPDMEGASTHFVADLKIDGDVVSGEMFHLLHANEAWQATSDWRGSDAGQAGQTYCRAVFNVNGRIEDDVSVPCTICVGVIADLTLDRTKSDCPSAKMLDYQDSYPGVGWGIVRNADGSATMWDTQRETWNNGLGDNGGVLVWQTGVCERYGTSECS